MCAKCNVLVNNGKVNDFRSLQYVGIQRIHTVRGRRRMARNNNGTRMYEQYCTVDGLKFLAYMCDDPINERTMQYLQFVRYKDYRAKIDCSYKDT